MRHRAVAFGLVALGAVLGGVMLLWLLVMLVGGQLAPGGAVLGLLLAAVLGLPLIGAGLYVLSRGKQEAVEEADFLRQRRTLESDRLFRAEQARELAQLADRLEQVGGPAVGLAGRLGDLVEDLDSPAHDQSGWYEAVELVRADQEALQRYQDLLSDSLRRMGELVDRLKSDQSVLPELERAADSWERDLGRRSALLRGRRAPSVAATDLLGARPTEASGEALAALKAGDAVSREGVDYLVEASVSYFGGGRTWWLHRLSAEQAEAWLHVSPAALSLAWLREVKAEGQPGAAKIEHEGSVCSLEESVIAAASVVVRSGLTTDATVMTWRYRCDNGRLLWLERWPEGDRAYGGEPIAAHDLQIWPASAPSDFGLQI